jgi:nuclear GTP-binding protein
MTKRNKQGKSN